MERKSLCESLKHHSIGAQDIPSTSNINHHPPRPNMFKTSCLASAAAAVYQSYGENHRRRHHPQSHLHDYVPGGGLSWPPRMYACTFCKREFRSAQALGGHMNVHRRDRARLRQLSPPSSSAAPVFTDCHYSFPSFDPDNTPNPNPSPTSNLSSSSSASILPMRSHTPFNPTFTAVVSQIHLSAPSPFLRPGSTHETKVIEEDFLYGLESVVKHPARIEDLCPWTKGLANNTGLIKLGMDVEVVKKDLDLELRLGWPY